MRAARRLHHRGGAGFDSGGWLNVSKTIYHLEGLRLPTETLESSMKLFLVEAFQTDHTGNQNKIRNKIRVIGSSIVV